MNEIFKSCLNSNKIEFILAREGEADVTLADVEETSRLLNWYPKRNVQEYIENWLKENITNK